MARAIVWDVNDPWAHLRYRVETDFQLELLRIDSAMAPIGAFIDAMMQMFCAFAFAPTFDLNLFAEQGS